ncbi:TPA: restriction endonuclease subunit S [Enterobacter hormaechei subsp. xiangfangensis]|uniref:Restriction endonuclease subunit S n=2 Tax=Enterobacteriaceae TaxID=543 RepID=A0A3N2RVN6_9ENTR|nr:restriction endonuclease subunit S [Kluyvera ascorbata]MBT1857033.1 restriction endonuclease subunit S [Enterobacter hormaechei subsp. xiangfangensis]ROU11445.1 restriction endonuclease subunit S [Kluyvera ascorbata]HCM9427134.1 restriction endonuclease subunit S [Enterobacter hormaechei subsp. xiangfangensis]
MVPKGWTLGTLNDLADTIMGYAFRSEDFVPTGIPLLRMGNLYQNSLDLNRNPVYLPDSFKVDYKKFLVKPGDLVMSMTGTMGKRDYGFTVEIPSNTQYSLLNQRVLKIVPKNNSSSGYILNLLRSELILSVLYSFPGGTKQANLSAKQVQELPVLIPPLAEQKKIAEILSIWDKAISVTEKLLTNSQQQKKALMQQLLTGKKRLLDENGVRFSTEWEFKRISEIATRVQRKNDAAEHPILTISSLSGFVRQDERYSRYMAGESVKNYILLKKGEFAYNKGNSKTYEFGCIFDLEAYEAGLVPHVYVCFRLKNGLSHRYFKYLFEADYLKPQLGALVNTGVRNNGLLNIKPTEFMQTKVPVPCFEEQESIADMLYNSSRTIRVLQDKLACLKDEKKALMQQLLTGKRRVKVDEAVAE